MTKLIMVSKERINSVYQWLHVKNKPFGYYLIDKALAELKVKLGVYLFHLGSRWTLACYLGTILLLTAGLIFALLSKESHKILPCNIQSNVPSSLCTQYQKIIIMNG